MTKFITLELSDQAEVDLRGLTVQLGLSSIHETIRVSVSLAKFLKQQEEEGNEIVLRHEVTGKERVIRTKKAVER